jgi:hypothetical protein
VSPLDIMLILGDLKVRDKQFLLVEENRIFDRS